MTINIFQACRCGWSYEELWRWPVFWIPHTPAHYHAWVILLIETKYMIHNNAQCIPDHIRPRGLGLESLWLKSALENNRLHATAHTAGYEMRRWDDDDWRHFLCPHQCLSQSLVPSSSSLPTVAISLPVLMVFGLGRWGSNKPHSGVECSGRRSLFWFCILMSSSCAHSTVGDWEYE